MKRTKTQKGITLIALIITIVVLLILAAVAISSITNEGILNYAKNAAQGYNNAATNEQTWLGYYENYLKNHSTGTVGGGAGDDITGGDAGTEDDTPVEEEETYTVSGTWIMSPANTTLQTENVRFTTQNGETYNSITASRCDDEYAIAPYMYYDDVLVYYPDGAALAWKDNNYSYQRITFDGTQTVSKEFYDWLNASSHEFALDDSNSVVGVWILNDNVDQYYMSASVNFTSNGQTYNNIYNNFDVVYYGLEFGGSTVYDGSTWTNEAYKTIDFGTERQEVSNELLYWLSQNATKQ